MRLKTWKTPKIGIFKISKISYGRLNLILLIRVTEVKIFTPLYDHLYCPIDKKTIKKMVHSETSTVYDIGQIKHCKNT